MAEWKTFRTFVCKTAVTMNRIPVNPFLRMAVVALLLAILPSPVVAQQLEVVSFEVALQDNSAWNSQTRRELPDGRFCPIVKVELNEKELAFEGNLIGGQVFKTNEYWVYMNVGAYHLVIKHPDYEKLDVHFADVNPNIKRLQEKHTYILKLKGDGKKGLDALAQGDAASMLQQAKNYENGIGSYNKDLTQALVWYEKAAEAGSLEAQLYLADVLYRGANGYLRDAEKAFRWNEACAQQGQAACFLPLAELYAGLNQNSQFVKWLRKHCETHPQDGPQLLRLGKQFGVEKEEGFKWLQMASEAGNIEATSLCLAYLKQTSPKDAVPFYLRAIDGGDMAAAWEYGQILLEGRYGIPKDEAEGRRLLELAASSIFTTYSSYKSDDPAFQPYVSDIPNLLSRIKNRDVEAMTTMLLIYHALGDRDMTARMLTLVRYNLSQTTALPAVSDTYLLQKAGCEGQNWENLLYDGMDPEAVNKEDYFKLVKTVIDKIVLADTPDLTVMIHYNDDIKDEATRLLVRWAKDYYDQDCLDKLSTPSVLSNLNVYIEGEDDEDDKKGNFHNFQITGRDGAIAATSEYASKVIIAMYQMAQQEWDVEDEQTSDNYKRAFKQLEKYAKQAEKKTPSFKNRIPYSPWIRKLKDEGYLWQ